MDFHPIPEMVNGLPNLCGCEAQVEAVTARRDPVYLHRDQPQLDRLQSVCAVALHMQQPLIPAGGHDIHTADTISNLDLMCATPAWATITTPASSPTATAGWATSSLTWSSQGKNPRIMLDYSGRTAVRSAQDGPRRRARPSAAASPRGTYCAVCRMAGHHVGPCGGLLDPVARSFNLHMRAWQHNFAAVYGWDALARVKGFSPPEMHLPNHPDAAYEYVKALLGVRLSAGCWSRNTRVETLEGAAVCRIGTCLIGLWRKNSSGEEVSIIALIKTQGSDTKLVAQMQPFYEAKGQQRTTAPVQGTVGQRHSRSADRHADRRRREWRRDDERVSRRAIVKPSTRSAPKAWSTPTAPNTWR